MGEVIVSTKSGNDYYIFTDAEKGITYVVNTRETIRRGKLVAAHTKQYPGHLPAVELGKPWEIPGFYTTSDAESIILKYKIASPNYADVDQKIDGPKLRKSKIQSHYSIILQDPSLSLHATP
jgi:hypothetical protein